MSAESPPNQNTSTSQQNLRPTAKKLPGRQNKSFASKLWDLLQPFARLWGIITAIAMSGAGTEMLVLGYSAAPSLLCGAGVIFILETLWVIALFVDVACRRGGYPLPLRCWDFFRWTVARARAPLYACAATALLISDLTLFATVAGGMLLVLAALRAAVPFSPYVHRPHQARAGSTLLSQADTPLPDVFYNAATSRDHRSEEMTVLSSGSPGSSRSVTPKPPLLEL